MTEYLCRRMLSAAAIALLAVPALQAAEYPSKPVRWVIAFAPGGPSDILSRFIGGRLSEAVKQPFVFDNRPGAGGNVAGEIAAKSPPDGYTVLLGNNSILATNASLYQKMNFDPVTNHDSRLSRLRTGR